MRRIRPLQDVCAQLAQSGPKPGPVRHAPSAGYLQCSADLLTMVMAVMKAQKALLTLTDSALHSQKNAGGKQCPCVQWKL